MSHRPNPLRAAALAGLATFVVLVGAALAYGVAQAQDDGTAVVVPARDVGDYDGVRPGSDRQNAVVEFESGCIGVLMSHYGVGYRIQRAEVHGEDISAYLDLTRGPNVEVYEATAEGGANGSFRGSPMQELLDLDAVGGAQFNEVRHFVDCILEDRTPWSNLEDAVHTMRLCEAINSGHKGEL